MAHADPFRLRLLKNLGTLLMTCQTSNGFHVDVDAVYRGRQEFGEGDVLPFISILEVPLAPDQVRAPFESSLGAGPYELIVQGFILDEKTNPSDPAHVFAADVEQILAVEKEKEGAGTVLGMKEISRLEFERAVCRPPDDVSACAYFWLRLDITIAEDFADPYA